MQFRQAEPADSAGLAALLLRASPGRTLEAESEYVRRYFERPQTVIQIAVRDAEPVGVVSFGPSLAREEEGADALTAYLRLIAVDPTLRGSGLARHLLQWAHSRMGAVGFAHAYLWRAVSNARAGRFYERAGWTADGRRREHEDWGPMLAYARQVFDAHVPA
jgi:ribosomal protein S18 acetylase RimI-like enzyme